MLCLAIRHVIFWLGGSVLHIMLFKKVVDPASTFFWNVPH